MIGLKKALVGLHIAVLFFSAQAAPSAPVRIGFFPNLTHAQALYGKGTGDFEKNGGRPIKWNSFNAGPTAIEALYGNSIDLTFIGPGPAINGYEKSRGQKFVIISGCAIGGAGLIVRGDSTVHGDQDFHGKIVASAQLGNTQDIAARLWFSSRNYRFKDRGGSLTLYPLSNADQLNLFRRKQIDAAWTIEPWLSRLEVEGGGRIFLEERSLWPDGKYVTTHIIVSRTFLAEHKDWVKSFLETHVALTIKINSDKSAAGKFLNEQLQKETGKKLKDEVIEKAMARVEFSWDPVAPSLFKVAEAAHKIGFLRTPPKLEGIYALSTLNQVLSERGLPTVQGP